ncbi:MarR family winged helix-turn-helix transcriptional regulator [Dokdonella sp. MW10]|uniref:MarR family winged helix-turn-helix transcriptional regulator n=1 Tax=Dokdonella sp. MW10 TaxID=2992926 RepID=UPI003F7E9F8D
MRSMEDLRLQVSSGLILSARLWQRVVDNALSGHGISNAMTTPLLMIGRTGGGIRQVDLAQLIGVEGPTLVRTLDKLGEAGLVRRDPDPYDRRANRLSLTEEGEALRQQLEERLTELREATFAELSAQDMETVLSFYRIVAEAARGT